MDWRIIQLEDTLLFVLLLLDYLFNQMDQKEKNDIKLIKEIQVRNDISGQRRENNFTGQTSTTDQIC